MIMRLPGIIELARGTSADFVRYEYPNLWYVLTYDADGVTKQFEFPINQSDAHGAVFLAHDKPIFFMRWMRKHLEFLRKAQEEANSAD